MALFLISYDLHKQRDYEPLLKQLRTWGCTRALASMWLGDLTGNAGQVRDALKATVDGDDSIVVVELKAGSGWSTWNGKAAAEWFRTKMTA